MKGSQFDTNCTTMSIGQLKEINLTRGITAVICAFVVALVFFFLICNGAFKQRTERLLLYLLFGTAVTELIKALGMERQFHYDHQEIVCKWLAFITYWSSCTMFTFAFSIVNYLLTLVISNIMSTDNRITSWNQSWRCREVKIEVLITIPPILVSFILAWVPYIKDSYGVSGPFCWVRSTRYDENCTKAIDITSQMIYYGLYELVGIVSVILCIIFFAMYYKIRKSYQFGKARRLLRKALILMTFQIIYVITVSFQLFTRLYTAFTGAHKSYEIWIVYAIISPFRQLVFPLACLFTFFSLRKLYQFVPFKKCRCYSTNSADHDHQQKSSAKTVPDSTRVSAKSSTFFVVPHPKSNFASYGSVLEETT